MAFLLSNKVLGSDWWSSNIAYSYFSQLTTPEVVIGVFLFLFVLVTKFYILKWHEGCDDPRTKKKVTSYSGIFAGLTCAVGLTVAVITTLHSYNWNITQPAQNIAATVGNAATTTAKSVVSAAQAVNAGYAPTAPPGYY